MFFKIPSNTNHAMILWFYDIPVCVVLVGFVCVCAWVVFFSAQPAKAKQRCLKLQYHLGINLFIFPDRRYLYKAFQHQQCEYLLPVPSSTPHTAPSASCFAAHPHPALMQPEQLHLSKQTEIPHICKPGRTEEKPAQFLAKHGFRWAVWPWFIPECYPSPRLAVINEDVCVQQQRGHAGRNSCSLRWAAAMPSVLQLPPSWCLPSVPLLLPAAHLLCCLCPQLLTSSHGGF